MSVKWDCRCGYIENTKLHCEACWGRLDQTAKADEPILDGDYTPPGAFAEAYGLEAQPGGAVIGVDPAVPGADQTGQLGMQKTETGFVITDGGPAGVGADA